MIILCIETRKTRDDRLIDRHANGCRESCLKNTLTLFLGNAITNNMQNGFSILVLGKVYINSQLTRTSDDCYIRIHYNGRTQSTPRMLAAGDESVGERVNSYHKIKKTETIIEALEPDELEFLWNSTFGSFYGISLLGLEMGTIP
ncbi:hypothetical protein YC2023_039042 [Brassica napus]